MNRTFVLRGPKRLWRRRGWSLRWEAIADETRRAFSVALPVIIVGAAGISAATISLVSDRPGLAAVAGTVGLFAAAAVAEAFPLPIEGVALCIFASYS